MKQFHLLVLEMKTAVPPVLPLARVYFVKRFEPVLLEYKPDWVLVYGDTNTTLAGALAAVKLHIPLAHVEAGLRSFNKCMPEEINRLLTDQISDILFAPTKAAVDNLLREGISEERICLVGDVMYDAALYYGQKASLRDRVFKELGLENRGYILATLHRAENTDDLARLGAVLRGLAQIERNIRVIMPLHPRTRAAMMKGGLYKEVAQSICLVEPVGYLDMLILEKNARMIVTDSGGVQKEAFFFRVPCVTLRVETEWIETVSLRWNRLVPPISAEAVSSGIKAGLRDPEGLEAQPYGNGHSAENIVNIILSSTKYANNIKVS